MSVKYSMSIEQLRCRTRQMECVVAQLDCMHRQVQHLECKGLCRGRCGVMCSKIISKMARVLCRGRRGVMCSKIISKMERVHVDASGLLWRQRLSSKRFAELCGEEERQKRILSSLKAFRRCCGGPSSSQCWLLARATERLHTTQRLLCLETKARRITRDIGSIVQRYDI